MAYIAVWGEQEHKIEVMAASDPWKVKVNDAVHDVDVLTIGDGLYSLLVDGWSYEVDVLEEQGALLVLLKGQAFRLEIQEERRRRLPKAGREIKVGRQAIVAPMPGKVVKVLVVRGDQVSVGDGIIVVEAMKMENELKAAGPGVVREIKVGEGQVVDGGEVLVVIE